MLSSNNKLKLLIIGSGPTSALISYLISINSKLNDMIDIHVMEKSHRAGGRFSTSKISTPKDAPENLQSLKLLVDLGAQYLTHTVGNSNSHLIFQNLKDANLLRSIDISKIPGFVQKDSDYAKENYASLNGTQSIVEHFFNHSNASIKFNTRVKSLNLVSGSDGLERYEVEHDKNNAEANSFSYDAVISTIPVPQLLEFSNFQTCFLNNNSGLKTKLEDVSYTTRYALGLYFDKPLNLDSLESPINYSTVKNSSICYWALEKFKRTGEVAENDLLVIHSSVEAGLRSNENPEELKMTFLKESKELIPLLKTNEPTLIKLHRWKYSQIKTPYSNSPGFVEIKKNPFLIATGDSFTSSNFEGCIQAAYKTLNYIESIFL